MFGAFMNEATMDYQIQNWFMYHTPKGDQTEQYQALRAKGKELALMIHKLCPMGDDRDAAIRKVREAIMTANAAIACGPEPKEKAPAIDVDAELERMREEENPPATRTGNVTDVTRRQE